MTLARGQILHRIHSGSYGATEFNDRKANNPFQGGRFDSANGDYTYLYAGRRLNGAVVETLLRDVPSLGPAPMVLPLAKLTSRRVSQIRVERHLQLVDLSGPGAIALGQDTWLTACDASEYPHTRHWATVIRRWCPDAAGFQWRSRLDNNQLSLVIFGDRITGDSLTKVGRSTLLAAGTGRTLLRPVLGDYGIALP